MHTLPELRRGRLLVVVAPKAARTEMLTLVAHLASRGSLRVLDAGNSFNAYTVARILRRLLPRPSGEGAGGTGQAFSAALQRITVARAFTCYQTLVLLQRTPASVEPTVVLGLLGTFHDESVPLPERRRLLARSLARLRQLSRLAPVAVSARLPQATRPESPALVAMLRAAADQVWSLELPEPSPRPRLF